VTATNHALTGAIIGLIVGQPWVAVPTAVASHFVCDALPHFKPNLPDKVLLKTRGFRNYLVADAGLCVLLVVCLAIFQTQHWLLASICAFAATSPDLLWLNKYLRIRRSKSWQRSSFAKFAGGIQWFQRPIGAVVEVAWFIAALIILIPFLR